MLLLALIFFFSFSLAICISLFTRLSLCASCYLPFRSLTLPSPSSLSHPSKLPKTQSPSSTPNTFHFSYRCVISQIFLLSLNYSLYAPRPPFCSALRPLPPLLSLSLHCPWVGREGEAPVRPQPRGQGSTAEHP